jgi:CBS domain-containing protein
MRRITLFIFGGVAEMEDEPPTPKSELLMAIAGPIVSVVLAGGFFLTSSVGKWLGWTAPVTGVLAYLGFINGVLVAFNLVPAFPLDGGRVLRSLLWSRKGSLREATRVASRIGSGFGVLLIALGVASVLVGNFVGGMWWFLIGLFLRGASQRSYQHLQLHQMLQGEPVRRIMQTEPPTVPSSISVAELVEDYVYKYNRRMFPVVRGSTLVGYVTIRAVKRIPRSEWNRHSVQELLEEWSKKNVVDPDNDAMETLATMRRTGNSQLMVVEDSRLAGVVALRDILNFLAMRLDLEEDDAPIEVVGDLQSLPK